MDVAAVPVAIDERLTTTFADIGRSAFDSPLFDDVVEAAPAGTLRFRVPAHEVLAAEATGSAWRPAGLVCHTGRCGSTLLCNLLTATEDWVAVKEPEFLNDLLLRLVEEPEDVERRRVARLAAQLLCGVADGTGRMEGDRRRRCVVKLSSWNVLVVDGVVAALGPVPLVVLVRDPWSTVESLLAAPPHWFGSGRRHSSAEDRATLFAQAWSQMVDAALRLPRRQTLLIAHADLVADPAVVRHQVARHLGDHASEVDVDRLRAVASRYAKGRQREPYDPAGRHRRARLSRELRDVVTAIAGRSWTTLGERRSRAAAAG